MLNNNVSFSEKQVLNTKNIKSTHNIYQSCHSIVPLATAAFCLLNLSQSALAADINTQIAADKITFSHPSLAQDDSSTYEHDCRHHNHSSGLLPRILSLITAPFQTHLDALSKAYFHQENHQEILQADGMGGSFVQNLAPIYLSQATSSSA